MPSRFSTLGGWLNIVGALTILAFGLPMLGLGVELVVLRGSPYYVVAGALLTLSAIEMLRERAAGYWLNLATLAGTIVWAFWEAGPHPLALAPRLAVFATIAIVYWLCWRWIGPRLFPDVAPGRRRAMAGAPLVALVVVAVGSAIVFADSGQHPLVPDTIEATAFPEATVADSASRADPASWPNYGRSPGGGRYSPLDQITPANVASLERAWVYHSGAVPRGIENHGGREFMFEATPVVVHDRLVFCTPHAETIALDPASGRELWRFAAPVNTAFVPFLACRGVAYDETPGADGLCARRVLFATVTARLYALDLATGARCPGFGTNGEVDLAVGMGTFSPSLYYVSSAPTIVHGKAVIGGWVRDNYSSDEPSGVVRAFDTATGRLTWAFDMGRPDRTGAPPPGETYTKRTPNVWAPMSADPALGLVFLPTGNQTPDFYGAGRLPASEEYASSLNALDADTGRVKWRFQTVHHDLWDFDVPADPVLLDIPERPGAAPTPAVVLATKLGEVFLFDRRDGRPLTSIAERPVPQGAVGSDWTSPTQPFPDVPSMRPPRLTESRMWGLTPIDQLACRIAFRRMRYDGPFTPPSLQGSLFYPGSLGVFEWGGVSIDPTRALMIANTSWIAVANQIEPRGKTNAGTMVAAGDLGGPMYGTPYTAHIFAFVSALGVPCQQPPWGHLTAIDLATRRIVWRQAFGSARDAGPLMIPARLPLTVGVPSLGGSVVTAGGLVFVAATADRTFRAIDARTGKVLWQDELPAGGQATPAVYRAANGNEYVVIAAGGHTGMSSTLGDAMFAYALP